mmetsp:Transcript_49285/g.141022  ORF Transcript_49285/g.141022 Transcript_49285/m.141022 type:complete len:183 (-) Transcript_49285:105-653(-)
MAAVPQSPEWRRRFRVQFKKTALCRFAAKGCCRHGQDACAFAHGPDDLEAMPDLKKTKLCKAWAERGLCELPGNTCPFAHGTEDLRVTKAFEGATLSRKFRALSKASTDVSSNSGGEVFADWSENQEGQLPSSDGEEEATKKSFRDVGSPQWCQYCDIIQESNAQSCRECGRLLNTLFTLTL